MPAHSLQCAPCTMPTPGKCHPSAHLCEARAHVRLGARSRRGAGGAHAAEQARLAAALGVGAVGACRTALTEGQQSVA